MAAIVKAGTAAILGYLSTQAEFNPHNPKVDSLMPQVSSFVPTYQDSLLWLQNTFIPDISPLSVRAPCANGRFITLPETPTLSMCDDSFHTIYDAFLQPEKELHHGLLVQEPGQPPVRVVVKFANLSKKLAEREAACASDMQSSPGFVKFYGKQNYGGKGTAHIYEFVHGKPLFNYNYENKLEDKAGGDGSVDEGDQAAALNEIACFTEQILKARLEMFKKGWFHADMHLGNVISSDVEKYIFNADTRCPKLTVIDYDMVEKLSSDKYSPHEVLRMAKDALFTLNELYGTFRLYSSALLHRRFLPVGAQKAGSTLPVKIHPQVLQTLKEVCAEVGDKYAIESTKFDKQIENLVQYFDNYN